MSAEKDQPKLEKEKQQKEQEPPVITEPATPAGGSKANSKNSKSAATEKQPDKENSSPKNEQKKSQPQTHKPTPAKQAKVKQPKEKKGGGMRTFLLLLILLVLLGLGAGGYWLYQQNTGVVQNLDGEFEEQRLLIAGVQRGLEKERELRRQQAAQLQNQVAGIDNALVAQQNRVRELGGSSRTDWLLAEAEFLLRLASQRLIIERDASNAQALLATADEILRGIDDVALMSVRRAVANDITALNLLSEVDTEGLYFRLAAISGQIEVVPLLPVIKDEGVDVAGKQLLNQQQEVPWWKQLWHNFTAALSGLKDLVRIQHHPTQVRPLLTEAQQQHVKLALSLVLEQAQVALLRNQGAVYENSLSKAQQYLSDYYQLDAGAGKLISQLQGLKEQSLSESYPDISSGLKSLQNYIDARHARHAPARQEGVQ